MSTEEVSTASLKANKLPYSGISLSRVDTPTQHQHRTVSLSSKTQRDDIMRSAEEETVLGRDVTFQDLLACGLTMDELHELEATHSALCQ